ncbi:MAG: adenosylcobinamide-GDP ribazoletransferase, partial [Oscillospiraceae bacterium]
TQPMEGKKAAVILALWAAVTAGGMLLADPLTGVASLLAAGLTLLYYGVMSRRQFGGITGDLAGFFLQICECAMVLAVVLAQHIEVLL